MIQARKPSDSGAGDSRPSDPNAGGGESKDSNSGSDPAASREVLTDAADPEDVSDVASDLNNFRAKVDSYNGPLDLLLYLIKKEEIDVFDIPLARVIDQYRLYLELLKEIDPNICGEYIVLAAQLIEIKSKMLLPTETIDEEAEDYDDPRLELVRQLLEFKKYKERALLLENRFEEYRRRYHRPYKSLPDLSIEDLGAISLGKVDVWDLLTAFQRVQFALGSRGPHRVFLRERPLSEYVARIESVLDSAENRTAEFEELFEDAVNREDAIGLFLGILEMCKQFRLAVEQEGDFGRITIRLRDAEETARFKSWDTAEIESDSDPTEEQLVRGEGAEARVEPIAVADSAVAESDAFGEHESASEGANTTERSEKGSQE